MGFLLGNSAFLQPPLSPLSSSSSFSSPLLLCSHRKAVKKKIMTAMAALQDEGPVDGGNSPQRRAFLFVGISVLPLLQLRAIAGEDPAKAFAMVSQARGLATIFISPRNRNKDLKSKSPDLSDKAKTEVSDNQNTENLEAQGSQKTEQEISSQKPTEVLKFETKQEMSTREPTKIFKSEMKQETSTGEPTKIFKSEQVVPQSAPGYSFVSFLNVVGVIASGVLGALYATSQKEKADMESTIESMKSKLTESEAATALLNKDFENKLLKEQEERRKQVRRLEEGKASLLSRLSSANGTIAALGRELHSEKKLAEELKAQINQFENDIIQGGEDKNKLEARLKEKMDTIDVLQDRASLLSLEINDKEKNIENLKFLLAEKESECQNLSSIVDQTRADLAEANSTMEQLKEEILKTREELNSKESSINDLNAIVKSLHAERNETNKKFHDLTKEYEDYKSSAESRTALDSELLTKKDDQLRQLEEKLGLALKEANSKQAMIAELSKQRDDAKALLEKEVDGIEKLKNEFQTTQEKLRASRIEASNLSKELEEAKRSYEELVSKVSKIQHEFYEANKSLNSNLDEARSTSEALSNELVSIKEILKATQEELGATTKELKSVMEDRESLKRELLEIYKKVETTAQDLKEERKVVATLNRELEVLGKQMLKDSEARRALEADLDEATKSLDEMNKNALLLSKELENTNSRTASLEAEKKMLFQSLIEQKNIAKEAKENIEDAQSIIIRLGSERGSLEKKSKKLEEELASAKGEILRLRRQINMSKESVNKHHSKINEVAAGTPVAVKKTVSRRRKGSSASEAS